MFLPLHDGVPLKNMKTPLATRSLIAALHRRLSASPSTVPSARTRWWAGLGLIPSVLFGTEVLPDGLSLRAGRADARHQHLPARLAVPSHRQHAVSLGVRRQCGGCHGASPLRRCSSCSAASPRAWPMPSSRPEPHRPLIGASGGVSGVVAAYLILYPRVRIWGLFLKGIPLQLPAYWTIGFWFALQFVSAFLGGDDSVGWFAHLGGFVVGRYSHPAHAASLRSRARPRRGAGAAGAALTIRVDHRAPKVDSPLRLDALGSRPPFSYMSGGLVSGHIRIRPLVRTDE